jgi:hypothetical protein
MHMRDIAHGIATSPVHVRVQLLIPVVLQLDSLAGTTLQQPVEICERKLRARICKRCSDVGSAAREIRARHTHTSQGTHLHVLRVAEAVRRRGVELLGEPALTPQ